MVQALRMRKHTELAKNRLVQRQGHQTTDHRAELDDLRKAISKKIAEKVKKHRNKFVKGASGNGIPKDIATKIFDMFFVGHDEIRGNGLGLYTVKTAVKVLNGKIHLVNDEEGKTTFEIILPSNI